MESQPKLPLTVSRRTGNLAPDCPERRVLLTTPSLSSSPGFPGPEQPAVCRECDSQRDGRTEGQRGRGKTCSFPPDSRVPEQQAAYTAPEFQTREFLRLVPVGTPRVIGRPSHRGNKVTPRPRDALKPVLLDQFFPLLGEAPANVDPLRVKQGRQLHFSTRRKNAASLTLALAKCQWLRADSVTPR